MIDANDDTPDPRTLSRWEDDGGYIPTVQRSAMLTQARTSLIDERRHVRPEVWSKVTQGVGS